MKLKSICIRVFPVLLLLPLLLYGTGGAAFAATAGDFKKDKEYNRSTGLEAIHAAEAYKLGFTGQGATIAVLDTTFAAEINEFAGKYPYGLYYMPGDGDNHGIHVSGIAAAARDGKGMHGTAFDADLLGFANCGSLMKNNKEILGLAAFRELLNYPDVRIVSNSWGDNYFLDVKYSDTVEKKWLKKYRPFIDSAINLAAADKLMIFAAGNEGHIGALTSMGVLPAKLTQIGQEHNLWRNWINVAAFDPRQPSSSAAFTAAFSNMGQGAPQITLMAPGLEIYSTVSDSTYAFNSGTSMATPYVAGAAALVQSAFPYMGGRQIADTLFSTATKLSLAEGNIPRFLVLDREEFRPGAEKPYSNRIMIYYPESHPGKPTLTRKEINALKRHLVYKYDIKDAEYVRMSDAAYEELFGQGVLNAGKAVRGPGYFDADRLLPEDKSTENGNNYAIYSVDTKGYDSVWSNDIGQKKASTGALAKLDLGLRKQGGGILYLTGQNTYAGPTLVEGGTISLGAADSNRPAEEGNTSLSMADSDRAELAGDVRVLPRGTFTGNGLVRGNLWNSGVLAAGLEEISDSELEVSGKVTSRPGGVIRFTLGANGAPGQLKAESILIKNGASLQVGNARAARPHSQFDFQIMSAAKSLVVESKVNERIEISPFISFQGTPDGRDYRLKMETRSLGSLPGFQSETADVGDSMDAMYRSLMGNELQERMDYLYYLDGGSAGRMANSLRGDIHAATFTALPFSNMLRQAVLTGPVRRTIPLLPSASEVDGQPLASTGKTTSESGPSSGISGEANGFGMWIQPMVGYSHTQGRDSIGQSAANANMYGVALGVQGLNGDFHYGIFGGIGYGRLNQGDARADIYDYRLGLYGGWDWQGISLKATVNGGLQNYRTKRDIMTDRRGELTSGFGGRSLGAAADFSYNVLQGLDLRSALKPYAAYDIEGIWQDGRGESGDDLYALKINAKDVTRSNFSTGLRYEYAAKDGITFSANAGYRRLLTGNKPSLNAHFIGASNPDFSIIGPNEGRDFLTCGLGLDLALGTNFSLSAGFHGEKADKGHQYGGFVNLAYKF